LNIKHYEIGTIFTSN